VEDSALTRDRRSGKPKIDVEADVLEARRRRHRGLATATAALLGAGQFEATAGRIARAAQASAS